MSDHDDSDPAGAGSLTHLDEQGRARMVDVSEKAVTSRTAVARAAVRLGAALRERLFAGDLPKGDALPVARIAAIQAAKETSRIIPLCHALPLGGVTVEFSRFGDHEVEILVTAKCRGNTGVEMEALTAASVAALTIYDMCKAVEKGIRIGPIELVEKTGGKSGDWRREGDA